MHVSPQVPVAGLYNYPFSQGLAMHVLVLVSTNSELQVSQVWLLLQTSQPYPHD